MNANVASQAYAKIGVESGALGADPHKLISMLYQGALLAIASAKNGIMRKNIAAKGAAISKAVTIIDEGLNASLDKKVGGELAENLSSLYSYMTVRLTQANLNNDMGALDEVARLLNDLKGAWETIRPGGPIGAPAAEVAPPAAKVSQVYAVPAAAPLTQAAPVQPQAKVAVAQAKPASVAAVPSQAKAASAAPVAVAQPKPVAAATAAAPAKAANAPPSLPPQQQRMANKVQSLYGRM